MSGFIVMALLGLACHFLKTLASLRQAGEIHVRARDYFRDQPYSTGLAVISTVAAVVILQEAGQLSYAAAFGTGYFADSVADFMRPRIQKTYG